MRTDNFGIDDDLKRLIPVQVKAGDQPGGDHLHDIVGISCGRSGTHSLAVTDQGRVWAWGRDDLGQVGNGDDPGADVLVPVQVLAGEQDGDPNLHDIVQVSGGAFHSLAMEKPAAGGHVFEWGSDDYDDLSSNMNKTPVQVLSGGQSDVPGSYLKGIVQISAGWSHNMALEEISQTDPNMTGRVFTWGNNGTGSDGGGGRLGNGQTNGFEADPVLVKIAFGIDDLTDIVAIGAGESHCMALDTNGNVWTWGSNKYSQLGDGTEDDSPTAVKVVGGQMGTEYLENIVTISAGYWHCMAIDADGVLWTWGKSEAGRLGIGYAMNNYEVPQRVPCIETGKNIDKFDDTGEGNCVSPDSANDEVTYTITYGPDGRDHTNVIITDHFPVGVDCPTDLDPNFYDSVAHTYTWFIGDLAADDPNGTITITAAVNQCAEPRTYMDNLVHIESDQTEAWTSVQTEVCCYGGDIIYVDAAAQQGCNTGLSWLDAYTNLQDALARARADCGNQIWVAEGIYTPPLPGDPNASFDLVDGVAIYGGFAGTEQSLSERDYVSNRTYLNGSTEPNTPYIVTAYHGITESAMLDGFTVRGAQNAGIYLLGYDPYDPNRTDFIVEPVIANCIISNNAGHGIYARDADPNIIGCVISENDGCGIYDCNDSAIVIDRCRIAKNAQAGISIVKGLNARITNSWIHNNSGDGIKIITSDPGVLIRNNTIANNTGYGIYIDSGNSPAIKQCILWDNGTDMTVNCTPTWSCFAGASGNDNIDVLPKFLDPTSPNYDYHLKWDSECIDAGDPDYVPFDNETDIDGNPRILEGETQTYAEPNGIIDMGADEVACSTATSGLDFNCDGIINLSELKVFVQAWLAETGEINWDQRCDLDTSNMIDLADFDLFAENWLWEAPWYPGSSAASMPLSAEGMMAMAMMQPMSTFEVATPVLTTEEQIDQLEGTIDWLEYIWQYDEDINTTIDEVQWLDFIDTVYDTLDELQSQ